MENTEPDSIYSVNTMVAIEAHCVCRAFACAGRVLSRCSWTYTRQKKTRKQNTRRTHHRARPLVVALVTVPRARARARHHGNMLYVKYCTTCGNKQTDLLPPRDESPRRSDVPFSTCSLSNRVTRARQGRIDGDFN